MKRTMMSVASVAALSIAVASCGAPANTETAQTAEASGLAGNWKANVESASFENDNRNWVFADGTFDCQSCLPPYQMAANGEWQDVDRPGSDSQMIEIVDDTTIKSASRFEGTDVGNATWIMGEDGDSLTLEWTDLEGTEPVTGKTLFTRIAAGPDGSHPASGEWAVSEVGEMSDSGLVFSFELDGDQYMSTGNGSTFTATIGGDPVPIEGSNAGTMVAVEKISDTSYRETYSRDGEVTSVLEMSVEGDTLSGTSTDPRDDSVVRWTATRQ
ncbi:MAG: hypothetical protein AAGE86_07850 [Pseudomonadota bacterium]